MHLSPVKSAAEFKEFIGADKTLIGKDLSNLNPKFRTRRRAFVHEDKLLFACNQNVLRMGKKKLRRAIEGSEGSIEFIDTNGRYILVGWSYEDVPGCQVVAFDEELTQMDEIKTVREMEDADGRIVLTPALVSLVVKDEQTLFLTEDGEVRCWSYEDTSYIDELPVVHTFLEYEEHKTFLGIEFLNDFVFYVVESSRIIVFNTITQSEDEFYVDNSMGDNAYKDIIAYAKDGTDCILLTGCGVLQSVSLVERNKINWRIGIPIKHKYCKFPAELDLHILNGKKMVTIVWTQNKKLEMRTSLKPGGKKGIGANLINMVPDEQEEIFAISIENNATSLPVLLPSPLEYIKKVVKMRSDKKVLDYTKARPHLVVYKDTLYVFCGMYLLKYEEQEPDEDELLEYLTNMFYDSEEKTSCVEVDLTEFELPSDWSFSLPETVIQTDYQLGAKGTRNNIARMMDMTFPMSVESHEIDGSMNELQCANIVYNTMREEELSVKKISEVRMKRMSYLQNMTAMEQSLANEGTLVEREPETTVIPSAQNDEEMEVKEEVLSSDAESVAAMDFRDFLELPDESILAGFEPQSQIALPEPSSQTDSIIASKGTIYSLGAPVNSSTQKSSSNEREIPPKKPRTPLKTPRKNRRSILPVADLSGIIEEKSQAESSQESRVGDETGVGQSQDLFASQPISQTPSTQNPFSQINDTQSQTFNFEDSQNTAFRSAGSSQNKTMASIEGSQKTPKSSTKKEKKEERMKKKKMNARKSIGF